MRNPASILAAILLPLTAFPAVTIDHCLEKAVENRGWLPRIGVYGQATVSDL